MTLRIWLGGAEVKTGTYAEPKIRYFGSRTHRYKRNLYLSAWADRGRYSLMVSFQ